MEKNKYLIPVIFSIFCLLLTLAIFYKFAQYINQPMVKQESEDVCFRIKLADLEEVIKSQEQENPQT